MIIPEILAPAGSMEALYAAIHAGADAVYFGGKVLSARAYAGNFDQAEIKTATELLHQYGAKAYVTINTLVKNHELKLLEEIGDTLCLAGVDAVILQDMGAYLFFKKYFPQLILHASTQMTVHSIAGAERLHDLGFERVVLSRELTLHEVQKIMRTVPIEVETFVHGALCYCYSGQCQMSAAYGERSANRGRCAQPCRLPYQADAKNGYFLSLKDQMTLYHLPQLVAAGIHSFKIEGRMKNPEYVYTTASLYRKYRDLALSGKEYYVEENDIQKMNAVFSRGQTSEGYYFLRKSANMIFPEQPKTNKLTDPKTLSELAFVRQKPQQKQAIAMEFFAELHQPMHLTVSFCDDKTEIAPITVMGEVPVPAQKKAVLATDIEKPLRQVGETNFILERLDIRLPENVFIPLSQIKELRRRALLDADQIWKTWQRSKNSSYLPTDRQHPLPVDEIRVEYSKQKYRSPQISVLVRTEQQLEVALTSAVDRVYVEWSFIAIEKTREIIENWLKNTITYDKMFFLALPTILRNYEQERFWKEFTWLESAISFYGLKLGALIRTADALNYLTDKQIPIVLDHSINIWNRAAYRFYMEKDMPYDICLTNELSYIARSQIGNFEMVVYGKLATMQTANCLANVNSKEKNRASNPFCRVGALQSLDYITDRKGIALGYHRNCKTCSNTLFNPIPLYLADQDTSYAHCLRFELLDETPAEIAHCMEIIADIKAGNVIDQNPFSDFTRGHYSKGVE